jgi:hypothetical protein
MVRLLKRCLERDAGKRLRDIGEARFALETLGLEPEAPAAPGVATRPAPRRTLAVTIASCAAAVVAVAAVAIVGFSRRPAVRAPPFDSRSRSGQDELDGLAAAIP